MQLELKHLACYLPYGLKFSDGISIHTLDEENLCGVVCDMKHLYIIKPILRPLSDLTEEIEHNGVRFVPIERLIEDFDKHGENGFDFSYLNTSPLNYPYYIVQKLFEWHFDVFNLIPSDLAIDINTLTK